MPIKKSSASPFLVHEIVINGVVFSTFLAKNFFRPSWSNSYLLSLVKRARKSYLRYGSVPLIDGYDSKSLVLLVRATYFHKFNNKNVKLTEWFCLRFTPGEGLPEITEDFLLSVSGKKNLKHHIVKTFGLEHLKHFVSMSRICRITPSDNTGNFTLSANRYTLASFVLANRAFLSHNHQYGPFKYISGLFRPELLKNKFSVSLNGKKYPRYSAANNSLSIKGIGKIKIDRNFYIYSYPSYFLNLDGTYLCLKKLAAKKILTKQTLEVYLGHNCLSSMANFKSHSHKLGKFLAAKGRLQFSKISGNQLRQILNKKVKDGPSLKIMKTSLWNKDINYIFSNLKKIV
jgi:hypothetical protein